MLKQRNLRFESVKECGVPIARVLARRLHKGITININLYIMIIIIFLLGANKPGFGNFNYFIFFSII